MFGLGRPRAIGRPLLFSPTPVELKHEEREALAKTPRIDRWTPTHWHFQTRRGRDIAHYGIQTLYLGEAPSRGMIETTPPSAGLFHLPHDAFLARKNRAVLPFDPPSMIRGIGDWTILHPLTEEDAVAARPWFDPSGLRRESMVHFPKPTRSMPTLHMIGSRFGPSLPVLAPKGTDVGDLAEAVQHFQEEHGTGLPRRGATKTGRLALQG